MKKLLFLTLATSVIVATPAPTLGHSWYPQSCCSGIDCGPARIVERRADGTRIVQRISDGKTVVVPKEFLVQVSQDGALHVCIDDDTQELLCLFDGAGV